MNDVDSSKQWTLRPITPDDAAALYRLFGALSAEAKAAFHPHPFDLLTAQAIARGKRIAGPVWIAIDGSGEIGGYAFLTGWNTPWPTLGVAVDSKRQGQGLGFRLVRQLVDLARTHGKAGVQLTVYQDNAPAVSVYRKAGFEITRELYFMEVDFGPQTYHDFLRRQSNSVT
jgi:ribosomal protein S18 acetylase RimI-like enzyme